MAGSRDPFDDLLDLGDADEGAPPLPNSQPPKPDRWMVLTDDAEDFKSVSEDDLFGSSSKAHGATFDDLFGEGTSDKKTKKTTGHGTTFDDLFGEDKSSQNFENGSTRFEDLFPEECDPKPSVVTSKSNSQRVTKSNNSKKSNSSKTQDDDLFGSVAQEGNTNDGMFGSSKITDDSIDELFGPTSSKGAILSPSKEMVKSTEESSVSLPSKKQQMLSEGIPPTINTQKTLSETKPPYSNMQQTSSEEVPDRKTEESVDDFLGTTSNTKLSPGNRKTEPDLLMDTDRRQKRKPAGPPYEELFGEGFVDSQFSDSVDDLFGSPKERPKREKPEKNLDDIFGNSSMLSSSSKPDIDDLFGGSSIKSSRSTEDRPVHTTELSSTIVRETRSGSEESASKGVETKGNERISSTSSDREDIFPKLTPSKGGDGSNSAMVSGSDTIDGKVDILVSSDEKPKRNSCSELGERGEFDFSVIEDTSLLDPNITRHKSSLRKRGSLARRKKPTRSSMRRVVQQEEDIPSASAADEDQQKDITEDKQKDIGEDTSKSSPTRVEQQEHETSPQQKKSPVTGGKMLIGPDILAQSQLMKGIASKKGRPSVSPKAEGDADNSVSPRVGPDKALDTHRPVIKAGKPQLTPRLRASQAPDLKASSNIQTRPRTQDPKPDVVMSTLNYDKAKERNSAFSPPVLKPTVSVPEAGSSKVGMVTLEKVALRTTRSSSSPPEPKVTSPSEEKKVIHSELAQRKNSLRRISPAKSKDADEPNEEKRSQPTWLNDMKLRSTPRKIPDAISSKPDSKSEGDVVKVSIKPALLPRNRDVESPRMSENKPLTPRKPVMERPKSKIEAMKPAANLNGKGDASSRFPLGVKETNTATTDVPSWKRELAERKKKRKDDPMTTSTPPKSESQQDVAVNWRTQLSQKKKRPVTIAAGEVKAGSDSKQPEWALQAEQRRARLAKSGLFGQN